MGSTFLSPPAKRPLMADHPTTANGVLSVAATAFSSKRSKALQQPQLQVPVGHVAFRLVCHSSRVGGIIGKSGAAIKHLQLETASKIRIEDTLSGSDDRVIVIVAPSTPFKKLRFHRPSDSVAAAYGVSGGGEEYLVSAAQNALIRVLEKILDVAAEMEGVPVSELGGGIVVCRLLVEASEAGSVIGKGGKMIEKIRKESGCKIRVLLGDKLPTGVATSDEVVEIEGDILSVKKALIGVSQQLQECPLAERSRTESGLSESTSQHSLPDLHADLLQRTSVALPVTTNSTGYSLGGHPLSFDPDRNLTPDPKPQQQEIIFKILCSVDRIGGIIGKGGSIIKALQNETGVTIKIGPSVADCDERVVTITSMENPEVRYSAAQRAVVLVFARSVEAAPVKGLETSSSMGSSLSARLVVPSNQAGCLLGKGGVIVSEMRKATGAGIHIVRGDKVPKCASQSDEVVVISGNFENVQDALYQVTGRLRDSLFPSSVAGSRMSFSSIYEGTNNPYERARDRVLYQQGSHSQSLVPHTSILLRSDNIGLSHNIDRSPSPGLRRTQVEIILGANTRGAVDAGRGLAFAKAGIGFGSGSKSAIVTNTKVEILVPVNVINLVYGENGNKIAHINKISGAEVIFHDPLPGARVTKVVISGTPDQTSAAQSLLHAFLLTGPS
ncbi:hypothetical protein Ancab_027938 [Ancistrocladus abbreviatus]